MKKFFAGSLIAAGVAAANVTAAPTYQVKGLAGGSTMYFSELFMNALDSAGVEVDDVRPARLHPNGRFIRFPTGGGVLDLDGVIGEINHAGGLELTAPSGESVVLHNRTGVATGEQNMVTGIVEINGDISERLPLF